MARPRRIVLTIDASSGPVTKFLPDATLTDFDIVVKKVDLTSNQVTILPTPGLGQTIDGAGSQILTTRNQSFSFYNDLGQWWVA